MTIMEMLGQSGILSLFGMSTVFGFLVIMIITITVVGKIIHALGADKDIAPLAPAKTAAPAASGNDASVTAAISAAVNEYRKSN
jgi:oxaloacetate decarboxylase gamma subunit